jgi:hypothetical protein
LSPPINTLTQKHLQFTKVSRGVTGFFKRRMEGERMKGGIKEVRGGEEKERREGK